METSYFEREGVFANALKILFLFPVVSIINRQKITKYSIDSMIGFSWKPNDPYDEYDKKMSPLQITG